MEHEVSKYASILKDGSVLIGNSVVCDGFAEGRITAVFTHIHRDHILLFETALSRCDHILVTKPTYDMLVTMKGEALRFRNNLQAMDFNDSFYNKLGEKITLYQSNHILGSAQVLVLTADNIRILYSGDFNFPDIPVVKCDFLILDSTHGEPRFNLVYSRDSLTRRLVDLVKDELSHGKPILIKAHKGMLQEVMSLLDSKLIKEVKFLADKRDIQLMQVYNKYGISCQRELIHTNDNPIANRIIDAGIEGGLPYVHYHSIGGLMTNEEEYGVRTIKLSSDTKVFGGYAIRDSGNNRFVLDLSNHASYKHIIDYVRATGAKFVVTDSVRSTSGVALAKAIQDELGIHAIPSPNIAD